MNGAQMWPAYPTALPPPARPPASSRPPACQPASLPIPLKPRFLTNWYDPRVTRHIRRHFSCLAEHRPSSVPAAAGSGWSRAGAALKLIERQQRNCKRVESLSQKTKTYAAFIRQPTMKATPPAPSPRPIPLLSLGILLTPTQLYAILYWWAVWRTAFI